VFGNAVTTLYLSLHSDQVDPLQRLRSVHASMRASRGYTDQDPRLLADWQRYPRLNSGVMAAMSAIEDRKGRPAYSLTVSTVRGPGPLTISGANVVQLRSLGPLVGRFGLNITAWSYGEHFEVGIHCYAAAAENLDRLGDLICDEFDALSQEAQS
jgi:diacylglycerol O-acyltransferase / wax synthase